MMRFGNGYDQWTRGFRHGGGRGPGRGGWEEFGMEIAREVMGAGGMGGGRRRGRMFAGEELRLLLLKLAEDQPRHGYDLIRAIEERTGGAYAPSPGVVYPTLTLLADMGLVDEQPEGTRKLFAITDAGRSHLAERAEEAAALLARLDSLGGQARRGSASPVRRAMGNLKSVLAQRMATGAEGEGDHEVAAMIDDLAQRIERLGVDRS